MSRKQENKTQKVESITKKINPNISLITININGLRTQPKVKDCLII